MIEVFAFRKDRGYSGVPLAGKSDSLSRDLVTKLSKRLTETPDSGVFVVVVSSDRITLPKDMEVY